MNEHFINMIHPKRIKIIATQIVAQSQGKDAEEEERQQTEQTNDQMMHDRAGKKEQMEPMELTEPKVRRALLELPQIPAGFG